MAKFSSTDSGATILSKLNNTTITVGMDIGADYVCDGTADNVQIQAAIDYVNSLGGGEILIKRGTYDLASSISIIGINYVNIIGEGIDVTILKSSGGRIAKNDTAITYGMKFSDFTLDINNQAVGNALNLTSNAYDFQIRRLKIMNVNNGSCLFWPYVDRLLVEDCIFYDGGLSVAGDNAAGGQLVTTENMSIFRNNYFIKEYSLGAGLLTTGMTGNLLIEGNNFIDLSGNSYAAFSSENQSGASKTIKIHNNYCYKVGFSIGNSAHDSTTDSSEIIGNTLYGPLENSQAAISVYKNINSIISGNIIKNFGSGILSNSGTNVLIDNNIITDTNSSGSLVTFNKGSLWANGNTNIIISNNLCLDTTGLTPYGAYLTNNTNAYLENNKFTGPFTTNALKTTGTSAYLQMKDNNFTGTLSLGTITNKLIRNNTGYVTEASGTGTIANGATSATITHGLSVTPTLADISITLGENPTNTPGAIWVSNLGATTFVVNCENDPGSSGLDFAWKAICL